MRNSQVKLAFWGAKSYHAVAVAAISDHATHVGVGSSTDALEGFVAIERVSQR